MTTPKKPRPEIAGLQAAVDALKRQDEERRELFSSIGTFKLAFEPLAVRYEKAAFRKTLAEDLVGTKSLAGRQNFVRALQATDFSRSVQAPAIGSMVEQLQRAALRGAEMWALGGFDETESCCAGMDRTTGPRLKIKRAKKHIADLEGELVEFVGTPPDPYSAVTKVDPDTGDLLYVADVHPGAQERLDLLALMAGDAIHNLRAALDFVAWQLVDANSGSAGRWTSFPVAETREDFESRGPECIRGASEDAVKLLHAVRPYKGGNDALWRLHRLDIADKHRLLLAMGSSYKSARVYYAILDRVFDFDLAPHTKVFPVVNETELYRIRSADRQTAKKHPEPQFAFEVAISDGDVIKGEPVIPTLHDAVGAVEQVIRVFRPILDLPAGPLP